MAAHQAYSQSLEATVSLVWLVEMSEVGTAGAHATPGLSGETVTAMCGALGDAAGRLVSTITRPAAMTSSEQD